MSMVVASRKQRLRRIAKVRSLYEHLLCATLPLASDKERARLEGGFRADIVSLYAKIGTIPSLVRAAANLRERRLRKDVGNNQEDPGDPGSSDSTDMLDALLSEGMTALLMERLGITPDEVKTLVEESLASIAERAGTEMTDVLGIDGGFGDWTSATDMFETLFPDLVAEVTGYIEGAVGLYAASVARMLISGVRAGSPETDIIDEIAQQVEDMTRSQIDRIVSTESSRVWNTVAMETMQQNDITHVRWLTMRDELVCEDCMAQAALGWVLIDDADTPPEHPHCRCELTPLLAHWIAPDEAWTGDEGDLAASVALKFNPYHVPSGTEGGQFTTAGDIATHTMNDHPLTSLGRFAEHPHGKYAGVHRHGKHGAIITRNRHLAVTKFNPNHVPSGEGVASRIIETMDNEETTQPLTEKDERKLDLLVWAALREREKAKKAKETK